MSQRVISRDWRECLRRLAASRDADTAHKRAALLALVKKGADIDYDGATGDLNFDRYNNVFGPYGAFRAGLDGVEQQVALLSAEDLARATP